MGHCGNVEETVARDRHHRDYDELVRILGQRGPVDGAPVVDPHADGPQDVVGAELVADGAPHIDRVLCAADLRPPAVQMPGYLHRRRGRAVLLLRGELHVDPEVLRAVEPRSERREAERRHDSGWGWGWGWRCRRCPGAGDCRAAAGPRSHTLGPAA